MPVTQKQIDHRMDAFVRACRQAGMKVTHQRMEIFREVASTDEHPDAETVYARVRERIPAVSRDTVYRALATLQELGLVCKVDLAGERARYDANEQPHHHFFCRRCGQVKDFYHEAVDDLLPLEQVRRWGSIESVQVQVRGVCRACRSTE